MKEERRNKEDGGRGNRVQWLNQSSVFLGNIIIFQMDGLSIYLSISSLSSKCEQILHECTMRTIHVEAGNVFYIIYHLLKVRALTHIMKLKTAQLNRNRHTCTSTICFMSVTYVQSESSRKRSERKTKRMSKSFVYLRSLPRYQGRQDKMKN